MLLNIGSMVFNGKFGQEIQNGFSGKVEQVCNSPKIYSLSWSFLKICFEVCEKPKSNNLSHGILVEGFVMPNFVDEYKTIFLGKRVKP